MAFVLHNSVVCGWLLDSQASAYSDSVLARLQVERAIVPPLIHLEYANVLRTACKRGKLIAQSAQEAIRQLQVLPLDTDRDIPDPALLLTLALRHNLTAYDAAYIELALRKQLPIATVDGELADAARVSGVGVFSPAKTNVESPG